MLKESTEITGEGPINGATEAAPEGWQWRKIGDENAEVTVPPNTTVRYGDASSGQYVERVMSGTFRADNGNFGDPASGAVKTVEAKMDAQQVAMQKRSELMLKLMTLNEECNDAIERIELASIAELWTMSRPPSACDTVLEALCIIFEISLAKFEQKSRIVPLKKKFFEGPKSLIKEMQNLDRKSISEDKIDKLKPIINHPLFCVEALEKNSLGAAQLCKAVCVLYSYCIASREVKPFLLPAGRNKVGSSLEIHTKSTKFELNTNRISSPSTLSRPGSRQQYSPKVILPPISPEKKSLIKLWSKSHVILDSGKQKHIRDLSVFLSYDNTNATNMEKVYLLREKLLEKGYIVYEHDGSQFPCRFNEIDDATKEKLDKCCGYVAFISREFYRNRYCKLLAHHAFTKVNRQKRKVFEAMFVMVQGTFTTYSVPEKIGGWLQFLIKDSLWYPGWNVPHIDGAFESIEKVVSLLALEVDIECRDVIPSYGHKASSRPSSKQVSRSESKNSLSLNRSRASSIEVNLPQAESKGLGPESAGGASVRLVIKDTLSGNRDNGVQLGNLRFKDHNGVVILASEYTLSAEGDVKGGGTGKEFLDNLSNNGTEPWNKWFHHPANRSWVQADFKSSIKISSYGICSASDCPERDPDQFEFQSRPSSLHEWEAVHDVSRCPFSSRLQWVWYDLLNSEKNASLSNLTSLPDKNESKESPKKEESPVVDEYTDDYYPPDDK